jgi:hypothetical protein
VSLCGGTGAIAAVDAVGRRCSTRIRSVQYLSSTRLSPEHGRPSDDRRETHLAPDATMNSDRLLGDRDGVFNTCNPRGFLSDLLRGLPHEAGAHFAGQVHDVIKGLNID